MLPLLVQGVAMSTFFIAMLTISLDGVRRRRCPPPPASPTSPASRRQLRGFDRHHAWDRRESLHQTRLAEASTDYGLAYHQATAQLQSLGMDPLQSAAALLRQVVNQAYLLSTIELSWICGWLALAMIAVVWVTRRATPSGEVLAAD
jgi:DHA2 family multidrug resistance protein